jgi:hypothetical protein
MFEQEGDFPSAGNPDRHATEPAEPDAIIAPVLDGAIQWQLIAEAAEQAARLGKLAVPAVRDSGVSLAAYQTPFKVQGDRGTCWAFAGAAALEAAYRRKYGITLDLSEEYIFHVGKAFEIQRDTYLSSPSAVENNSSLSGFQGGSDIAAKLAILAVPEERFAPYLASDQTLQNIVRQLGYSGSAALSTQEDFDAFEFCEQHIPLIARVNARYRATAWGALGANPSITAIENTLLAKHEVLADVYHKVSPEGGHVLLIIGFDRNRQLFFAKNSWGEDEFVEIHYYNDPIWDIRAGHYLIDVAELDAPVQNDACWVGNWTINLNGKAGRLLIRRCIDLRLPGPTKLGNYYVDGKKFEVNGTLEDEGRTLHMFVASEEGKLPPGTLSGTEISVSLAFQDIFNAGGNAADGSPVLLSRYASRFAAIWQQGIDHPWEARHGLTAEQYQSTFDQFRRDGYRPLQVCGYSQGFGARYAAIWSLIDGPAWEARHGLSAADYQDTFNSLVARGYRLTNISGYAINGGARYAAIWEQSAGPEWQARHGMTAQQYQETFEQLLSDGFRPLQVCGYRVNAEVLFAAIWERRDGPPWEARHGLTAAEYQNTFDDLVAQGYRLIWVNGYSASGKARYAAIWEQSADAGWQARHGLDGVQYQKSFDDLVNQGYAPVQVCGYGDGC